MSIKFSVKLAADSLIFDMDGTLWDAVETYTLAWNTALQNMGIQLHLAENKLYPLMGLEKQKVGQALLAEFAEDVKEKIFAEVERTTDVLIPARGGTLYPGVADGLKLLSRSYKLFIVSNCPENTIDQFVAFYDLSNYITDSIAHGFNLKSKSDNIKLLVEKHNLQSPVYIGDTESDYQQSRLAGIPFFLVSYGFGTAAVYENKFERFSELTSYFTATNQLSDSSEKGN